MYVSQLSKRKHVRYLAVFFLTILFTISSSAQTGIFSAVKNFDSSPEAVKSIYFDGINGYAEMDNTLNLNPSGFTISLWVNRDSNDSGTKSIISKRESNFSSGFDLRLTDNNFIELVWYAESRQTAITNTAIPDNEWHQIVAVYNGETLTFLIDGVADSSHLKLPPIPCENVFKLATCGQAEISQKFNGRLDEIRIWNIALTKAQCHYMMNQEITNQNGFVSGKIVPSTIAKNDLSNIPWSSLDAYYPLNFDVNSTTDASGNGHHGTLMHINSTDDKSAPLPYTSKVDGNWTDTLTWENDNTQPVPNSYSIVDNSITIDWNIVKVAHNLTIDTDEVMGKSIKLQSLLIDDAKLTIEGQLENVTGNGLNISHYLKLNGQLDLKGESQLLLEQNAELDVNSSGELYKALQGTADQYTYDYWCSPVGKANTTSNNNAFAVKNIIYNNGLPINFLTSGYNGSPGSPVGIADYWIWKFANNLDYDYSAWQHLRRSGTLLPGEGFTMKGPGTGIFSDKQNYTFKGKPNNGTIDLQLEAGNDYLVGNPYPSAIDANQFIMDNGLQNEVNEEPLINGTLYYWEHWGGGSHNVAEYRGGYATYNLSGAVGAPSLGTNDANLATGGSPIKIPSRFIPVGKGFFVVGKSVGQIQFNNAQRVYKKNNDNEVEDLRPKVRLGFDSATTIHRQLLLTIDENATVAKDWAYDSELFYEQKEDMFWIIEGEKYNIQGSNTLDSEITYPLGIKIFNNGMQKITIDALEHISENQDISIHDIENNSYHNLRETDFEFSLPMGEYLDKFELTFEDNASSTLTTKNNNQHSFNIYFDLNKKQLVVLNPNEIKINSINLFNLKGQSEMKFDNIQLSKRYEFELHNRCTGTFIVKIQSTHNTENKIVLIKQ